MNKKKNQDSDVDAQNPLRRRGGAPRVSAGDERAGGFGVPGFVFDLQFFGQERTEPATPKKRQKVRSEGRVCKSQDLTAAVEILAGLLGLLALGSSIASGLLGYLRGTIAFMGEGTLLREGWFYHLEYAAMWTYFQSWLPLGIAISVLVVAVTIRRWAGTSLSSLSN